MHFLHTITRQLNQVGIDTIRLKQLQIASKWPANWFDIFEDSLFHPEVSVTDIGGDICLVTNN